jgi:hypothetical protein
MHFEEVHQDAMVECRGCPKKYKYVYNRSRPKKIHHQAPCSAAGVNPRSALTVRKIDLTRSGRRLTAYKPENDSSEESAQRRGMWQDQGETIYSYLEAKKTCMPVGPPGRTEPRGAVERQQLDKRYRPQKRGEAKSQMGERCSGRPQPRARGTRGGRSQLQGREPIPGRGRAPPTPTSPRP